MEYRQLADILTHLKFDFWKGSSFDYFQVDGLRDIRITANNAESIRRELTDVCFILKIKHTSLIVNLPDDKTVIGLWVNLDDE